jgi:N-sulfoglucosamine sulfohydrolase
MLSLPVALESSGYRTARIGKYHVAPEAVFHFGVNLGAGKRAQRGELGRSPVEMADLTRSFIAGDGPFFLYFATMDPHRSAPHGHVNRFGNRDDGYAYTPTIHYRPEDVIVPPSCRIFPRCGPSSPNIMSLSRGSMRASRV